MMETVPVVVNMGNQGNNRYLEMFGVGPWGAAPGTWAGGYSVVLLQCCSAVGWLTRTTDKLCALRYLGRYRKVGSTLR